MTTATYNLFYGLPEVIQSEIYQYDNTYRIYNTDNFKFELADASFKQISNQCLKKITDYLKNAMFDDGDIYWYNEYGRIDTNDTHSDKTLPNFQSMDDIMIHLHHIGEALYYKILPKNSTIENCSYLREPKRFDGYFLDGNRISNYSQDEFDLLCVGRSTDRIDAYDSNFNVIKTRILMFWA